MNKKLNELVGGDPFSNGGDRNITGNSEIETGPVDKPFNDTSDYEKGIPTTTDKVVNRYRQNIPWFAIYSWGGSRRGVTSMVETTNNVLKKKTVEEKIEDLVQKSKTNDITDKNYDSKVDKIADSIKSATLTKAQIEELLKTLADKVDDLDKPKNI